MISELRTGIKCPKPKKPNMPLKHRLAQKAIHAYSEAHQAVYGTPVNGMFDGVYIRIHGNTAGVSTQRLISMTKQLKFRKPNYG